MGSNSANESFYEGISQEKDFSARIRIVEVLLFSFFLESVTILNVPEVQNSVLFHFIMTHISTYPFIPCAVDNTMYHVLGKSKVVGESCKWNERVFLV